MIPISVRASALALAAMFGASTPLSAAVTVVNVNANLLNGPISFSFMGGAFTFGGRDTFPNYLTVVTSSMATMPNSIAAVRTVFGNPSTDFTDRGTVIYDQNTLGGYGSFPATTAIGATNGNNYLGLRVAANGQNYYGFAYTTNATLNSYGFESTANTGINPTAALAAAAAVPEPAAWTMMVAGFGLVGAAMRSRRAAVSFT